MCEDKPTKAGIVILGVFALLTVFMCIFGVAFLVAANDVADEN